MGLTFFKIVQQTITTEAIQRIFDEYGPIVNVERIDCVSAHVSFHCDKDANSAMLNELKGVNALDAVIANIIPVLTWQHPPYYEMPPSQTKLNDLNDNCLLKIVDLCDFNARANLWDVCQRTRDLLDEFVLPREDTEYSILIDRPNQSLPALERVREELKYIRSHVKKLHIRFPRGSSIHLYPSNFRETFGKTFVRDRQFSL